MDAPHMTLEFDHSNGRAHGFHTAEQGAAHEVMSSMCNNVWSSDAIRHEFENIVPSHTRHKSHDTEKHGMK